MPIFCLEKFTRHGEVGDEQPRQPLPKTSVHGKSVHFQRGTLCWEGPFQGIDGPDERAMDRQVVKEEEGEGLNGSCENCEASSMTGQ